MKKMLELFNELYSMPKNLSGRDIKNVHEKLGKAYKICKEIDQYFFVDIPEPGKLRDREYGKIIKNLKGFFVKKTPDFFSGTDIGDLVANLQEEYEKIYKDFDRKQIAKMCSNLSVDLSEFKKGDRHIERIRKLLQRKKEYEGCSIDITENQGKGANIGHVAVVNQQQKLYIKTFSEDTDRLQTKKIDCREIFVYKTLELMQFGPQVDCLFKLYSSSDGSTALGNYIITKDIATISNSEKDDVKERIFLLDGDIKNLSDYEIAIKNKQFQVELFALVSINGILRLKDTFGVNAGNYGIVRTTTQNGETIYEPKLIDHLPYATNAVLKKPYSPRTTLAKKLSFFQSDGDVENQSCLCKLIDEIPSSKEISDQVKNIVLEGKKDSVGISEAIEQASKYVYQLVDGEYGSCFTENAQKELEEYVGKAKENLKIFEESYASSLLSL